MIFAIWIWQAHSSGAGQVQDRDRTGGPVADGFCGNCHSGGNFGTALSLSLHDENGDTVTAYQPGAKYSLRMKVTGEGASGFGFQAVALASDQAGAGTYGAPESGSQVTTINGRDYFEHSSRSTNGEWNIEWTAPETGAGDLTFYFAGNAVDGAGGTSGDQPATDSLTIIEEMTSGINRLAALGLQVAPNPIQFTTQISWSPQANVEQVDVFNLQGKSLLQMRVQPGADSQELDLSHAAPGLYQVVLRGSEGIQTQKLLKL